MKEWVIGYIKENNEIRVPGLTQVFYSEKEAREWFKYLCGPWRLELKEEAANEDLKHTNWANMTLNEKKKERHADLFNSS